jgi:hypothetical protein
MEAKKQINSIIRSTEAGRLYITSEDFFGQDKVKKMVEDLINSPVYKKIKERKPEKAF